MEKVETMLNVEKEKVYEKLMDVVNDNNDYFTPYSMRGRGRGVAFVINNIVFKNNEHHERYGADIDGKKLGELFTQMGFICIYCENLTHMDIMNKLKEFTDDSNKVLSEVDSCFLIVMSYGRRGSHFDEDTHIITSDNKEFKTSEIINKFSNSSCKSLQGKPKIFIFQMDTCESWVSTQLVSNMKIKTDKAEESQLIDITNLSDMLIYTSSCRFRKMKGYTRFIRNLCEIFKIFAQDTDVLNLFNMITERERIFLHSSDTVVINFRPCYLNPKSTHETYDNERSIEHSLSPIRTLKKGVVVVIDNTQLSHSCEERYHNKIDTERFFKLFTYLGFELRYWENDVENKLSKFVKESTLNEVDACFVIIMSNHDEIFDHKRFTSDIINKFTNSNCKSLQDKPKVIIFATNKQRQKFSVENIDIEDISDMLIYWNCNNYNDTAGFMQSFCETIVNHAHNTDIRTLVNMITPEEMFKRVMSINFSTYYLNHRKPLDQPLEKNTKTENLGLNMETKKIIVKTSKELMDVANGLKHKSLKPYSMRGNKRGVVLVINNIEFMNNRYERRKGAEVDAKKIKELFTQMGFIWIYWENQTYKNLTNKLQKFTHVSNDMLSEVDSCFVIVMSHGSENNVPEDTRIITHDSLEFKASDIINRFSNSNCKSLQGKPKVIIFQTYQSAMKDFGIKHISSKDARVNLQSAVSTTKSDICFELDMPMKSDMLVCFASSSTYMDSWFIQHFCETFMNYSYNIDVNQLCNIIAGEILEEGAENDTKQSIYIVTFNFRPCYLNPGL